MAADGYHWHAKEIEMKYSLTELGLFWSKVDKSAGIAACWLWTAGLTDNGSISHRYGKFNVTRDGQRRTVRAHRYVWEMVNGPIPKDMVVMHLCDNPKCVNPVHLAIGTHQENMDDMAIKGRAMTIGNRRVPRTMALRIRQDRAYGLTMLQLAKRYDLSGTTIRAICNGRWHPAPDNGFQVVVPPLHQPVTKTSRLVSKAV